MSVGPSYFLGANSPSGFYSLYSELISPREARVIYLLKGGAGCGKSTLMRRVEQSVREAGLRTECILCSGDPDSLDAVLLPDLGIALADATAPHVMEPKFPGAVERYVNLGDCYDYAALHELRDEIITCMTDYPACYARAYRCLEAASTLSEDVRNTLLTPQVSQRLARRARSILRRELKGRKSEEKGQVKQRFLSAVTHKGPVCLFETAQLLCPRICVLEDSFSLGHGLLLELLTGAVEAGYNVVACPDPMAPERLAHLLIPEAGVGFVTATQTLPYPGQSVRRIRLDSIADSAPVHTARSRQRLSLKVAAALREEAVASLAQAKAIHDELEALYNPHVDFDRVHRIAEEITSEILSISGRYF